MNKDTCKVIPQRTFGKSISLIAEENATGISKGDVVCRVSPAVLNQMLRPLQVYTHNKKPVIRAK